MNVEGHMGRREFVIAAAGLVGAVIVARLDPEETKHRFTQPELPNFPAIPDKIILPTAENWDEAHFEDAVDQAIDQSLDCKTPTTIQLPFGEMLFKHKIKRDFPKGAAVIFQGNCTNLKLAEPLSHLDSKKWGSKTHNLIEFNLDEDAAVGFDGVFFDGGSSKAGKGGYSAPVSPWDSVLRITGTGPGSGTAPSKQNIESRHGSVFIRNCLFLNSESEGALVQNVAYAEMTNTFGRNLDSLFVPCWVTKFKGKNLYAENILSDGVYIQDCGEGVLEDSMVRHARQGFDIQGSKNLTLRNCHAIDCAEAFLITESPSSQTRAKNIDISGSHSVDCALAYSLTSVDNVSIQHCTHAGLGNWYNSFDFMHTGITSRDNLLRVNAAVSVNRNYTHPTFRNIMMQISPHAPSGYRTPNEMNIEYFQG